ncbi:MAG: hypothetical protein WC829_03755 [Hyphomicrobium sp.]|jgi:hypothetical protein
MLRPISTALATLVLVLFSHAAGADQGTTHPWQANYTTRLEAYALLQTLNADLLSHNSATLTLDRWCDVHHLASPARIVAERVDGPEQPPTTEQRQILGVDPDEPVRFRRVRLKCGDHVLSEAENWYVPSRLTRDMNTLLDTTDTAFGRAVKPLNFRRQTLSAKLLWSPLPPDWETHAAIAPEPRDATLAIPHEVIEHRAILTLPDGTPFSQVVETYTGEVLAFPEPKADAQCN